MERGYAVLQHADGHVVRAAAETAIGEVLRVRLAEGQLHVRVEDLDA
jgi:exodeoxyribonuclease VII large subunit